MANLVLRTMYIDPEVDDELRTEAFDTRTSKNDLLRKYLKLGMQVAREARMHSGAVKTSTANADLMTEAIRRSAKPIANEVLANLSATKAGKAAAKKRTGTASGARKTAAKAAPAPIRSSATASGKAATASRKKAATAKAATA